MWFLHGCTWFVCLGFLRQPAPSRNWTPGSLSGTERAALKLRQNPRIAGRLFTRRPRANLQVRQRVRRVVVEIRIRRKCGPYFLRARGGGPRFLVASRDLHRPIVVRREDNETPARRMLGAVVMLLVVLERRN